MPNPLEVGLDVAAPSDAVLLANLLELYLHDLSEAFPVIELGADGRFGYDKLPLYWSEPERRFPFLIRYRTKVAGFALITRGSPVSDDPDVFDVAEFFVIRRHRRSGVARQAAFLMWDSFPGRWNRSRVRGKHRRSSLLDERHRRLCEGLRHGVQASGQSERLARVLL